jgi:hypothetical protein
MLGAFSPDQTGQGTGRERASARVPGEQQWQPNLHGEESRVSRPHAAVLGFAPGLASMHDMDDYPRHDDRARPGRVPLRRTAVLLFFANADDFRSRALAALDDGTPARAFRLAEGAD